MFEFLHSPETGDLIQALSTTSRSLADYELSATRRQACAAFTSGASPRPLRANVQVHKLSISSYTRWPRELRETDHDSYAPQGDKK